MRDISPKYYFRALITLFAAPLVLFFLGFFQFAYGMIFTAILIALIFHADKEVTALLPRSVNFRPGHGLLAIIVIGTWCFFAGIGHFWYQNYDYTKHNGILFDLIHRPWPVYFETTQIGGPFYLVYYLGHYLLAGFIGKFTSFQTAEFSLFITSILALLCIYVLVGLLPQFQARKWIWILFPLLGGLDLVGSMYFTDAPDLQFGQLPEWWSGGGSFQYTGNTHALFWVPQHALGAWITMGLFMLAYHYRLLYLHFIIIICAFFWSPFVTAGLLPYSLLCLGREWRRVKLDWQKILPLTMGSIILGLVLLLFYSTIPKDSPKDDMISHLGGFQAFLPRYLRFVLLEFLMMLGACYWCLRTNKLFKSWKPLFLTLTICLFMWPLYYYGIFSDFSMRASLPSLFLLFMFLFWSMADAKWPSKRFSALLLLIVLGSFSFTSDMYRGFVKKEEYYPVTSMDTFTKDIVFQYLGNPKAPFFRDFFPPR